MRRFRIMWWRFCNNGTPFKILLQTKTFYLQIKPISSMIIYLGSEINQMHYISDFFVYFLTFLSGWTSQYWMHDWNGCRWDSIINVLCKTSYDKYEYHWNFSGMRYGVKRLILELQYMTSFYCLIRPWQNVIMTFLLHQEIGVMGIIQNDTYDKILSVTLPFYNHNIIPVASNIMDNKMHWINTNAKCSKFSSCYWISLIKCNILFASIDIQLLEIV